MSLPYRMDPHDLAQTGWAVLFSRDEDPAVYHHLRKLLDHRRSQAGKRYHELTHYSGESARKFLWYRHGESPGVVDPEILPYYILIVGDPETIPYEFQYELSINHAVGRLHFDDPADYARYAKSVVTAEEWGVGLPQRASIFAVDNEGDPTTALLREHLVDPLSRGLAKRAEWEVEVWDQERACKQQLCQLIGGDRTPGLLLVSCHGRHLPLGHVDQEKYQGALLCREWRPGNLIAEDQFFHAGDVGENGNVHGLVAFLFSCYGAGTPFIDNFPHQVREGMLTGKPPCPHPLALRPFVARLPQALLRSGALAVVGHVDRGWTLSFKWDFNGKSAEATRSLQDSLMQLLDGHRIGHTLRPIVRRYTAIATQLAESMERVRNGEPVDQEMVAFQWTAHNDARNLILLGDPAVYLLGGPSRNQNEVPKAATEEDFAYEVRVSDLPLQSAIPADATAARSPILLEDVADELFRYVSEAVQPLVEKITELEETHCSQDSHRWDAACAGLQSQSLLDVTLIIRCEEPDYRIRLSYLLSLKGFHCEPFDPVTIRRDSVLQLDSLLQEIQNLPCKDEETQKVAAQRLDGFGLTLSEELLPEKLRVWLWRLCGGARGAVGQAPTLLLQSNETWVPWELVRLRHPTDGTPGPSLVEAFSVCRWLQGLAPAPTLPSRAIGLVVPGDSGLPLVGAERDFMRSLASESRTVAEVPARSTDLMEALAAGRFDAWHFTGHGLASRPSPYLWGIQLEAGHRLMPTDLPARAHCLGECRPFVFLNACHTARGGFTLTGVGGLAQAFLKAGAGAFLGAQWALDGSKALAFAKRFYAQFLGGVPFAEAIRQARIWFRDEYPGDPTWLAYAAYGHPLAHAATVPDQRVRAAHSDLPGGGDAVMWDEVEHKLAAAQAAYRERRRREAYAFREGEEGESAHWAFKMGRPAIEAAEVRSRPSVPTLSELRKTDPGQRREEAAGRSISLDEDVLRYVVGKARKRGMTVEQWVNAVLRSRAQDDGFLEVPGQDEPIMLEGGEGPLLVEDPIGRYSAERAEGESTVQAGQHFIEEAGVPDEPVNPSPSDLPRGGELERRWSEEVEHKLAAAEATYRERRCREAPACKQGEGWPESKEAVQTGQRRIEEAGVPGQPVNLAPSGLPGGEELGADAPAAQDELEALPEIDSRQLSQLLVTSWRQEAPEYKDEVDLCREYEEASKEEIELLKRRR